MRTVSRFSGKPCEPMSLTADDENAEDEDECGGDDGSHPGSTCDGMIHASVMNGVPLNIHTVST